jgi:DNA mismatch repair protein MutS2
MCFSARTLEFDRVVEAVAGLALTPRGARALTALTPFTDPDAVARAIDATTETARYLESNPLFPLRAGAGLEEALAALRVAGRPLEPLALSTLADFLDSVDRARGAIRRAAGAFPLLAAAVSRAASFASEMAAVRHAIDPSGEVRDEASPALRRYRTELRQTRQRLRSTLEQFIRGRETTKYLQEQVITERNGRFVLVVRAEHRSNVPGIVHGTSASGASLFLEPSATVEINNDIVELEEHEREEIVRILLELTDAFRGRIEDLDASVEAATTLDTRQAAARFGSLVGGVAPELAVDGRLELRAARHPLLIGAVRRRLGAPDRVEAGSGGPAPSRAADGGEAVVVPVDIVIEPPARVLLITGPNTGGKTVALKTAGLLALMAQAGLHVPAASARLPVFRSVFADIGDEQSIAASLSTFSAHITNVVAMDRALDQPALVLLDEVGTGTDPSEGGALATAIVNHFRQRGAIVIATTHYDALKTWGTTTEGVVMAACAFDPKTYAPAYRLVYGAPGRSLAIEIAQRLGMPLPVVSAARGFLGDDQKRVAAHLARLDAEARALEADRTRLQRERRAVEEATSALTLREHALAEREARFARRLNEKLEDRVRQARRDIDRVIEQLKARSEELLAQASGRARSAGVSTGETGAARAEALEAVERIAAGSKADEPAARAESPAPAGPPRVGARVAVGALGLEGRIVRIHGRQAEIDVRGKRMRSPLDRLRVLAPAPTETARVRVNVALQPREGPVSELNVIGLTVEQAIDRVSRLLDDALVTDALEIRIVHGHGTGQLRRGLAAFLKEHPLVAKFYPAPQERGGEGATIVELKE